MNQRKAGALLSYVYLALTFVVGIFYTPFAISYLGKGEYGVFALATSAVSFLTILDMGFNQTMIRYVSRYKALGDRDGENRLNGMFLIFYTVIALIALVAGFIMSFFIEDIFAGSGGSGLSEWEAWELRIVFIILLINLVGSFPLGIYTAILNANEGFVVLKLINILTFLLTYGGMSIALIFGKGAITMAVITTTVSLLLKFVQGIYVQMKYAPKFRIRGWDRALFREVMAFSFFIFLNIVIDQLYANTDKFILGIVKNTTVVTIYSVGVQFSAYFEQFSTSISGVFLPRITALLTKDEQSDKDTENDSVSVSHGYIRTEKRNAAMDEVSEIFVRIGRIQFIVLGFLMSGFIVLGRLFLKAWVGEDMTDSYYITLAVITPAIIPLSQNIGISVIRALNRHRFRSVMYLGIAVFNVVLSIPLAIYFGGVGAACATGLGTILGQIITMNWFYYKKIGLDIPGYWREILKLLLVFIPLGLVGYGIHILPFWDSVTLWHGWLSFLLQGVIYTLIFIPAAWLFMFNEYEKDLFRSMLRKVMGLILSIRPVTDDVILESYPDFSGNALAIYEELLRRGYNSDHRIYWFVLDEESADKDLPEGVYTVVSSRQDIRSVWRRLRITYRCKYILDSNVYVKKVRSSQVRLHMGHGMLIKYMPEYMDYSAIGECDGFLTFGTYWKDIFTRMSHIPENKLVPVGYPRNDILVKKTNLSDVTTTGHDTAYSDDMRRTAENADEVYRGYFYHLPMREKFIIWMPTYRQHRKDADHRGKELSDAMAAADEGHWEVLAMRQLRNKNKPVMPFGMPEITDSAELEALDKKLGECGLMLYFRPHPSQDLYYVSKVSLENIRIADDEFLRRCDMSLYEVLKESEALITDYSSVYFDYLLLDKPVGLTFRDAPGYFLEYGCCFDDLENDLAGVKLNSCEDVLGFIEGVARDNTHVEADIAEHANSSRKSDKNGKERYALELYELSEARKWFHDVTDGSSTDRVIGWLREHGMPVGDFI